MGCGVKRDECEILAGGEAFLTLNLERANLGQDYQLLSFQSIDRAMSEFTRRFERVFVLIGAGGVYTPLKRKTPLCVLVGAFPGPMPPLIGWAAASGTLSLEAWVLYAMLFLWQGAVPWFQ